MNLHLAEITKEIAPGRHAALLLDQAGWHLSRRLVVPENITRVPLPPKCPELTAMALAECACPDTGRRLVATARACQIGLTGAD